MTKAALTSCIIPDNIRLGNEAATNAAQKDPKANDDGVALMCFAKSFPRFGTQDTL